MLSSCPVGALDDSLDDSLTGSVTDSFADLDLLASRFRRWADAHAEDLEPLTDHPLGDLDVAVAATAPVLRALHDAGWTRLGWPVEASGLGGSPLQRSVIYDELAAAGYVVPEILSALEIIGPMLVRHAPALAAACLPATLRGEEWWCQGFSEPDAGSDLGSLRTRTVPDGPGFRLTGQKMWSSFGHIARWCCVLARTGDPDSGHRGLTMFWVDLTAPGVTVRPTPCASGRAETAEIFLDDVLVAGDHVIGGVGQGWAVVMYLLQFERGAYAWMRQAELHTELQRLLAGPGDVPDAAAEVGDAYLALFALRSQALATTRRLYGGTDLGPEISVDKILLATTEQRVADVARELLWPGLEVDDGEPAATWRRLWAYSRITTIYGGAIEVQRDLVAERLLGLPRGRS